MKVRELVQQWLEEHSLIDYTKAAFFQSDFSTKDVLRILRKNNFPYSRDHLEIWRRWAAKTDNYTTPQVTSLRWDPSAGEYSDPEEEDYTYPDDIYEIPEEDIYEEKEEVLVVEPKLYVVLPDQQIPYHDKRLHELVLRWLDHNKPYGKIYSGDLIDLPGISRHDWNPDYDPDPLTSTMSAIRQTREYLKECEQAGGRGDDYLCEGNHENRLLKYVIKHAPHLYALEEESGERTLSVARMLNLPASGVKLAPGGWPQGKVWLSPKIAVMHGWLARSKSGVTAHATLDHLGHSVIVGHTHRKGQVFVTRHTYAGLDTLVAAEAGTLARIEDGLGYAMYPNWQNGFLTVRVYPNGNFHISDAIYVAGSLYWENQVLFKSDRGVVVSE